MGHTQLRIGLRGGRVKHRGGRRVRVVQRKKLMAIEKTKNNQKQKLVEKTKRKVFDVADPHDN